MSNFTYDDDTFSDLHKDAYGFRPRGAAYARWEAMTPAEKQAEWDYLCNVLERNQLEERRQELEAAIAFERRVEETIKTGAGDRETAIRWIKDAENVLGDYDENDALCWAVGLPFGYFTVGHYNYGGRV